MGTKITPLEGLNRDLKKIAKDLSEEQVVLVQKKLTLDTLAGVIKRTPVDEGRARGGWQVGISVPPSANSLGVKDKGEVGDPAGNTLDAGISALSGLGPFQVVFITNNVGYIVVLDQGMFDPKNPSEDEKSRKRRASRRSDARRKDAKSAYGNEGSSFVASGYSKQAPVGMVDVTIASLREDFK